MHNRRIGWILVLLLLLAVWPAQAAENVNYVSQPDEVYIFLNDIAFAHDTITLPANVDVQVFLPGQIYVNTLVVREGGERVPVYRIRQQNGQVILEWTHAENGESLREVTLEYLFGGLGWTPRYDMWLGDVTDTTVGFDFLAEIRNAALDLDEVTVHLIAGRVDTSQQVDTLSRMTANQYIAGYEESSPVSSGEVGAATIQYIYESGVVTTAQGDMLYVQLSHNTLPARRLLLWNAASDQQVTSIYKVRNTSDLPLTEGIVRSYQNGIFIGSDFVEITPVGSEGSVTVGKLQDVRVKRSENVITIREAVYDTLHQVELSLENFGTDPLEIEVVDFRNEYGELFVFSEEPQQDTDNLLRWVVTIPPGETVTITYEYKVD
jgi:hypothetical protein